jgi:predicted nucleotidyltransferase
MRPQDRLIAEELKERLSTAVKLVDFRVFGSRARGDADEYSDMDVFLEVESLDREVKKRVQEIVWEVGFENYMVISALIFTRGEMENSPLRASSIVKSIAEEGIRI